MNMNFSNTSNLNQAVESNEVTSTLSLYVSDGETASLVVFCVFFGSVGVLENLVLILAIILTDQFADKPSNIFVLSLAFADLLVCGVSAPLFIYNFYHPIFSIFINVSKFTAIASTGSIFTLSLDRFISLVRGMKYPKIMTFKRTVSLVASTWVVAIFVGISAVIGLVWKIMPDLKVTRYFIGFYILSTIVIDMYMYSLGRKHRKQLASQAYAVTGQVQEKFDEVRALRSLFMIAGTFVAFWMPLTVAAFLVDGRRDLVQFYRAHIFTAPLCLLNSVVDPVVYYYRSQGFRGSLKTFRRRLNNAGWCDC